MIQIKPIQPHQIEDIKQVILTVCQEVFQVSEAVIRRHDSLLDVEQVRSHYFDISAFIQSSDITTVLAQFF